MKESAPKIFKITQTVETSSGSKTEIVYREDDPLKNLEGKHIREVRAICFVGDKIVVVREPKHGRWNLPGGKVEQGESYTDAVAREVKEETNLEVLTQRAIGYIDSDEPEEMTSRYTFSLCVVKSGDGFIADPDEDISEIKLVDPKDIPQYYDWGPISQRIIAHALQMHGLQD